MSEIWVNVQPRAEGDPAWWQVEARAMGVGIVHHPTRTCLEWDAVNGAPGVYRSVGHVAFWRKRRRWSIRAYSDCGAVDLMTLIRAGCYFQERYGDKPGHLFRKRAWELGESPTGEPWSISEIGYQLTTEDLMHAASASEAVPDTIEGILLDTQP